LLSRDLVVSLVKPVPWHPTQAQKFMTPNQPRTALEVRMKIRVAESWATYITDFRRECDNPETKQRKLGENEPSQHPGFRPPSWRHWRLAGMEQP
jgi:hypothetical protein